MYLELIHVTFDGIHVKLESSIPTVSLGAEILPAVLHPSHFSDSNYFHVVVVEGYVLVVRWISHSILLQVRNSFQLVI